MGEVLPGRPTGILLNGNEPGRSGRLFTMDLEGGKPRAITPEGVVILNQMQISSRTASRLVAVGPDAARRRLPRPSPASREPIPGLTPDDYARCAGQRTDGPSTSSTSRPGPASWTSWMSRPASAPRGRSSTRPIPAGVVQIAPFLMTAGRIQHTFTRTADMLDDLYVASDLK